MYGHVNYSETIARCRSDVSTEYRRRGRRRRRRHRRHTINIQ